MQIYFANESFPESISPNNIDETMMMKTMNPCNAPGFFYICKPCEKSIIPQVRVNKINSSTQSRGIITVTENKSKSATATDSNDIIANDLNSSGSTNLNGEVNDNDRSTTSINHLNTTMQIVPNASVNVDSIPSSNHSIKSSNNPDGSTIQEKTVSQNKKDMVCRYFCKGT